MQVANSKTDASKGGHRPVKLAPHLDAMKQTSFSSYTTKTALQRGIARWRLNKPVTNLTG